MNELLQKLKTERQGFSFLRQLNSTISVSKTTFATYIHILTSNILQCTDDAFYYFFHTVTFAFSTLSVVLIISQSLHCLQPCTIFHYFILVLACFYFHCVKHLYLVDWSPVTNKISLRRNTFLSDFVLFWGHLVLKFSLCHGCIVQLFKSHCYQTLFRAFYQTFPTVWANNISCLQRAHAIT